MSPRSVTFPRPEPLACVIGDIDLLRPLGLAGIRCGVVAAPGAIVRYSRFTDAVIESVDPWKEPGELLARLLRFGEAQEARPVLYYQGDWDLLLVSRHREQLGEAFRFVVPDAELVEDLVDKERFQALAERLNLPVPPSVRISPDIELRPPIIVKPVTRQWETWEPFAGRTKAVHVQTVEELRDVAVRLADAGVDAVAQELVPGPETLIESYHVYVNRDGLVRGEFTGRKIRTYPPQYGSSTALLITDAADVRRLGRDLTSRIGLRGVAKFDFKRGRDGKLRLLEVNPRFSLWHHPGARAGVNLPALVYDDLVGTSRARIAPVCSGVRWCYNLHDARAARASGVPLRRWVPWALTCEAKSAWAWDDPMPVVRGSIWRVSRRLRSALNRRESEAPKTAESGAVRRSR
ncbi:MAG TPA: ATP-grasp domain-containing protein [Gaiellaceae bacterium]|nr:ATP-grasp domain-containing protein [Gaiellaceae bacterium]